MNIGSAIVCALPNQAGAVRDRLAGLPGVEVHGETADGRFVITVEDLPGAAVSDTVMQLHRLEGVMFAAMVYQYSDDEMQPGEAQG
jgi:periplasmic nitrate reductase NapD